MDRGNLDDIICIYYIYPGMWIDQKRCIRSGAKLCVSPASSNLMRVVIDPGDAVATAKKPMHMALQAAQVLQLVNDCQMSIMSTRTSEKFGRFLSLVDAFSCLKRVPFVWNEWIRLKFGPFGRLNRPNGPNGPNKGSEGIF
ncbi:hypothetical protein DL93DRAFT_2098281 [Clavulina sp. PMI_390]|nr:hypothetical protein DL93DRAFT_2098281 [Clavulina sp. PMI_390]